ncbi:MAG: hypothetical protein A2Y38_10215 [Spirochaetes bacterium GWB1_59_5]|nr:MAG: hypothetical protein A2Y38_10215 [Spirochaetes bacterium GWB1_59_5]
MKNYLNSSFQRILNDQELFLFYKGRVALYALLKTMGVGPGDEVLMPAYTCVVVPNAVKYLGAMPRYVDIELPSFSVKPEVLASAIKPATKAVTCQNTYGLSYGVDSIAAICRERGIYSIEDCTHGFGGTYKGKSNGSYCDAAFYSSQWNKPFSTGIGGYALVNNDALRESFAAYAASLPQPSLKTQAMLWTLMRVRNLISPGTYYAFVDAYRFLSKHNLVTGSSSGQELISTDMPPDYLMTMSGVQKRAAVKSLARLPELNALRKANGALYTAHLAKAGLNHVDPALHDDHLFLKYPLLVKDRETFTAKAKEAHIPLGDWFCSALHPIEGDLTPWDFDTSLYPNAVFAAAHVVNLPADTRAPEKVLDFVDKNMSLIFDKTVDGRIANS